MGVIQKYIVVKDRVEIYKDFAINLLYHIHKCYIDRESLSEDEDIFNHYSWCYNKVCDEFLKEDINFKNNAELKNYFYSYYYNQFYNVNDPNQNTSLSHYEKFWRNIFDVDKQKNKNILNILIEVYNIFDKSINKNKNIMEFI